jgi:hypothetical protein
MYENLPKNERAFDVDITGDTTGEKYKGQFVVKCVLSMSGRHTLELEKTRLMADYANPTRGLAGIAISLATVRAKISTAPDWWFNTSEGSDIIDENVIMTIYEKTEEMEANWRRELKEASKQATEESPPKKEEDSSGNPQTES